MTHDGHRERLKKRFLSSPDSFEDHELLELILFYSIPRKDTNEIAHELLNEFGSLPNVLNANPQYLKSFKNMTSSENFFMKFILKRFVFSESEPKDAIYCLIDLFNVSVSASIIATSIFFMLYFIPHCRF